MHPRTKNGVLMFMQAVNVHFQEYVQVTQLEETTIVKEFHYPILP
jgi:hypothetical protein